LLKIRASEKTIKLPRIKAKKKIEKKMYKQLLKIRAGEKIKISPRAKIKVKKINVILPPSVKAKKTKIIN